MKNSICFVWIIILLVSFQSCSKSDNNDQNISTDIGDYFPLIPGNSWTFQVEEIVPAGQIPPPYPPEPTFFEKWVVNDDLWLDYYNASDTPPTYGGYRIMYRHQAKFKKEIQDNLGTFVSTEYLNSELGKLYLVASDEGHTPKQRWVKGGLEKIQSEFGNLDCICTKTTNHFGRDPFDEYYAFCSGIGIFSKERQYYSEDLYGNKTITYIQKYTLVDFYIQ